MTMHLLDLQLAEALMEERLAAARRAHINPGRRHSAHEVSAKKSRRRGSVVLPWPAQLHRPAHGTAGH